MNKKDKFIFPNIKFPIFTGFEPGKCYIKPMFYGYENPSSEFLIVENGDLEKITKIFQESTT